MTGRTQAPVTTNDRQKASCGLENWTWTGSCGGPSSGERQYGRLQKIGLSADHPVVCESYGLGALILHLEHFVELSRGSTGSWFCPILHRAMFYDAPLVC